MEGDKKVLGNAAFKEGDYARAKELYTAAIDDYVNDADGLKAVLCNRAACSLKLGNPQECVDDSSASIELDRRYVKAYYRRAQAYIALVDGNSAARDIKLILNMDPSNKEAIALMREAAQLVQSKAAENSEIKRVLERLEEGKEIENSLKMLISLCSDDVSHTMEFGRRRGHIWLMNYIQSLTAEVVDCSELSSSTAHLLSLSVRVLLALAQHNKFIATSITIMNNADSYDAAASDGTGGYGDGNKRAPLLHNDKITFEGLCDLINCDGGELSRVSTSLLLKILQTWPRGEVVELAPTTEVLATPADVAEEVPRFEEVDSEGNSVEKKKPKRSDRKRPETNVVLYLKRLPAQRLVKAWMNVIRRKDCEPETYALSLDALIAFVSDMADYVTQNKVTDTRNEGMEERKERMKQFRIVKTRSTTHGEWAMDCGAFEVMMTLLDDPLETRRARAFSVLSRLLNSTDNELLIKSKAWPYIYHKWRPGVEYTEKSEEEKYDPSYAPPPAQCRRRAWLEACLLVTRPELGVWALERQGGMHQLMMLAATRDVQNQEAAAEVFCLAASVEGATGMLEPVVSSGILPLLQQSAAPDVRAAAASTMTKLSLKAKALATDSNETTHSLNIAVGVLKNAISSQHDSSGKGVTGEALAELSHRLTSVSFSHLDDTGSATSTHAHNVTEEQQHHLKKKSVASVERAVEVLAALVGRSAVKEELVHGSARVASPMNYLTALIFDDRSTAAYGIAHIFAALTVTNKELRDKALAEKDITPEQFEQLQELQRVKAKDEQGNPLEEKKEEIDTDTLDLCKRRIQKICDCGGFRALLRLLEHTSTQTKLAASTALRQMNVEPGVRGVFIQQGGLKACYDLVVNDAEDRAVRREAAHAMAKALVTTNPNMLSEHLRLSAMKPLIFLCKDTESSNLMQFECLLALTNLTSLGDRERDRFIAEKGMPAVHYLMFSDHLAVRRAATETLCNVSSKEAMLKLLRVADNVKLWVAFCEDWDSEESEEALATALAASGTLAVSSSDVGVSSALVQTGCGECISALLGSSNDGIVHRGLVLAIELVASGGVAARDHLGECGVVDSLTKLVQQKPALLELGKELAEAMSNAK